MQSEIQHLDVPQEPFYSRDHIWLVVDENLITLGITSYATELLGEILYVDLPEVGERINTSNTFAIIESSRNILDLIGPFTGTILEVNSLLMENPSLINDDNYGEGWILTAEIESEKDLGALLRHAEYKTHIHQLNQAETTQ